MGIIVHVRFAASPDRYIIDVYVVRLQIIGSLFYHPEPQIYIAFIIYIDLLILSQQVVGIDSRSSPRADGAPGLR